jgi:hypothetical protein
MNENAITREAAVARIRGQLILMQEEGKSLCQIATERNILCRGFHRDSTAALRNRYADELENVQQLSRAELEERANAWQLERQRSEGARLPCDVQYMFYETCRGWDDFSNADLSRFCLELLGEKVRVTGRRELVVL